MLESNLASLVGRAVIDDYHRAAIALDGDKRGTQAVRLVKGSNDNPMIVP
jgi:hypothetical protein